METEASPSPPVALGGPRHLRVLVVDDNEDARSTLSDALVQLGYTVMSADDGPTALTMAREFMPDVAVLDIGLPVMDGYELGQHLKADVKVRRLIAVTGYGQECDRTRAREAGFDAHLVKPVTLDALVRALEATASQPPL
jgi:CheY-like chemotaxis protein